MASLLPGQESLVVASGPANWSHRPSAAPSATHETAADCANSGSLQWETMGIIPGLSESDFMARQRYLVDHRCVLVSQPSFQGHGGEAERPTTSSSVHRQVQEQRKVLSTFKGQPWPMEMKKAAFKYYKNSIWRSKPEMNRFDKFRDSMTQLLRRTKYRADGMLHFFTIGNGHIKTIEGRFGSSVASFFTFLRWICALNLVLSLTVVGFLMLPQMVSGHGLEVPLQVRQEGSPVSFLFDGKGYVFEYSVLFYGYYDSGKNEPHVPPPANPHPYIGLFYKLPLAYILVMCVLFVISIGTILVNMAEKYKLLQRSNVSEQYPFTWKVFSGWDHAITHSETARLKATHLANSLRETISETDKMEGSFKVTRLVVRIITNSLVVLGLVSTSYAIVLAVESAESSLAGGTQQSFRSAVSQGIHGLWQFIVSFQVQIVIVCRNFILPWVFRLAEYFEKHHPRTALKLMLIRYSNDVRLVQVDCRMFILYTTSLYVLIIALLTLTQQCGREEGSPTNSTSSGTIASLFQILFATDGHGGRNESSTHEVSVGAGGGDCCWETIVGQELFKLSWSHLGTEVASLFLIEGGRWLAVKLRPCRRFGLGEFNLADNILRLVYGQALIWLGVFFCPLLPVIMFAKSILLFYIRVFAVRFFNRPPKSLFKVASTRNFYMALLLLMSFLCIFPVGYAAIRSTPSNYCGPFRGLTTMVDTVNIEMESWPEVVQQALGYLRTATVLVPLFGLLCIIVYYYAALSNALKEVNKDLLLQLHVERKETRSRVAKESLSKKKGAREAVEEKLENKMRKKQNHSMHKTSHHRQQPTNTSQQPTNTSQQQPHPLPRHSSTLAYSSTAHMSPRAIHPGAVIPNPHAHQQGSLSLPQGGQSSQVTSSHRGNTLGRPMVHHHTTGSIPRDCLRYV